MKRPALRMLLIGLLAPISCMATTPLARRLSEPMTRKPVDAFPTRPFPILVVQGDAPRVVMTDGRQMPVLPAGASFLISAGTEGRVERFLNESDARERDGSWVLNVTDLAAGRQHIELYWMADGYSGGGYEATATTVTPRYRKITGPGFGIVVLSKMLALGLPVWALAATAVWWATRTR